MNTIIVLSSIGRNGGGVSEAARLQSLAVSDRLQVSVDALASPFDDADLPAWYPVLVRRHVRLVRGKFGLSLSLLASLVRSKADLIHLHGLWQFPGAAVLLWSLATGRPYVVTPHGMLEPWILARSPWLKRMVSWLYQDRLLRRATAFHILTNKERQDVAPFSSGKIVEEIPNYVEPFERASERPSWWRPEFEGRRVFLFFGRIHEKKGCMELLESWSSCCADAAFRQGNVLVFCGWNDGLRPFEAHVEALGRLLGNVVFAGPQFGIDKQKSFSSAHFFVLPSKSEGLPMAVLEAWAAGVPAIMTEECNLPDGFERNAAIRTGSSVPAISQALTRAGRMDEAARLDMADRGRRLVEERYSKARVGTALTELYERCLQRDTHKRP